jgi:hypothetical protein
MAEFPSLGHVVVTVTDTFRDPDNLPLEFFAPPS